MNKLIQKICAVLLTSLTIVFAALFSVATAAAVERTWNNGNGDGKWNTTSANWSGTATWNNATPDDAVFGDTGAGTVTLTEAITAGTVAFSNTVAYTLSGSQLTVNGQVLKDGSNDLTINNGVAGNGRIIKTGGILILANNNTFAGGITNSAGTLRISHNNGFGTGPVALSGGSLQANGNITIPNEVTFDGNAGLSENATALRTTAFSGIVNLNRTDMNIAPGVNRDIHFTGTINGTADYVNLGRNPARIYGQLNYRNRLSADRR